MLKIQFSNMPSNRMSAALSVLAPRIFCEMFLRAPQALEFSHGLDPLRSWAVHCGNDFDARFEPYQSTHLSRYNALP
jgi:hypothetical protein